VPEAVVERSVPVVAPESLGGGPDPPSPSIGGPAVRR